LSTKGLQGRILELEDTIQQLHDLNQRLHDDIQEANRRTEIMRKKLKDVGLY
jgi:predicted  nucleic acid-binding Zn-ribbon protein